MRLSRLLLIASHAPIAGACVESPSVDEATLVGYAEGKEDDIRGRAVEITFLHAEARVTGSVYRGLAHVAELADGTIVVETERIVLQPNHDADRVEITAAPAGTIASIRDELHFALYARPATTVAWERIAIEHRGHEMLHFSRIEVDLGLGTLAYASRDPETGARLEGAVLESLDFDADTQFAVAVVPYSTWFSLAGVYASRVTARCSGGPCLGHRDASSLDRRYRLPERAAFPESGDFDPVGQAFFVGSMEHGGITRIAADGSDSIFVPGEVPWATLGVAVDPAGDAVWVCAVRKDEGQVYPGIVTAYGLDHGEVLATFDLADVLPRGSCNDVVADGRGRAYVTDRENPAIYELDRSTGSSRIWAWDEDLLDSSLVGTNGIAITPDGHRILATNYIPSRLMVIDREDPSDVRRVALHGDAFHEALGGADAIRFLDNALYVAFPSNLARIVPVNDSWHEARVQMVRLPSKGHSGLILAEDNLYLTNGHPLDFVLGRSPGEFHLERFDWTRAD